MNTPDRIEPLKPESETPLAIDEKELPRLIAEWNRGVAATVEKMKKAGANLSEAEPFKREYIPEIVRYIKDSGAREREQDSDMMAMKAVIFLEWAEENGKTIFKKEEPEQAKQRREVA